MRPLGWFATLLLATAALSAGAAGDGALPGDAAVARAVQRAALPQGRGLAEAVNRIGEAFPGTIGLAILFALLLLGRGCRAEALLVAATLPLRLLNGLLKSVIGSPRPATDDLIEVIERADGFGFPSGHASGAVLFYGALFAVAPCLLRSPPTRRLFRTVCVGMIVLAGLSRVAVGAHWPSDVIGGYLWGGVLLALLLVAYRRAGHRRPRRSPAGADA